jgi:hypothetical protein
MFQGLFGVLVSRQMILFSVMHRRGTMRVRRQLMKFRSSLVGIVWHSGLRLVLMSIFEPFPYSRCSIPYTRRDFVKSCFDAPFHRHFIPFPGNEGPTGRPAKRQYRCT